MWRPYALDRACICTVLTDESALRSSTLVLSSRVMSTPSRTCSWGRRSTTAGLWTELRATWKTKQNKKTNKCLVKQSGYQPLLRNINSGDEPSLLWGIWDKYDAMWLPVYLPCSQQLFQWPSWQQHIGPFPAEGTLYARLYTQPVQPQNCLFLQDTSALMRLWVHANGCPLKKEETDFG